ncbi:flagellar assembly protein FliH [Sulfurospirillum arcachonense]|uniref:flagellar assembly protein FliH n=1 Tax=Sulfurospirillum arcachonense TaxID=57666 RepID=UPI00046AA043|nr:flagellar assembly protein FliH [Sulfurospirillum arcachonense]
MKNIIDTAKAKNHTIEPYRFKVLGGVNTVHESEEEIIKKEVIPETPSIEPSPLPQTEILIQQDEQQNKFIEELLKKSDELSTNIIKLQMQIEKQEVEFENRLQKEVKRESETAFETGYQKAQSELLDSTEEVKKKFFNSINILEEEVKKGNDFLKQIETELSQTAIEVAKEVILKEIKHSSSEIAIALSKKLIEELKDVKNIKLKINPKDFEALNDVYSDIENIRVESDTAITEGGVVVLSDAGNLDGNITTRLEKVKNLIENG